MHDNVSQPAQTRRCSRCKQELGLGAFARTNESDRPKHARVSRYCRPCKREAEAERHQCYVAHTRELAASWQLREPPSRLTDWDAECRNISAPTD